MSLYLLTNQFPPLGVGVRADIISLSGEAGLCSFSEAVFQPYGRSVRQTPNYYG